MKRKTKHRQTLVWNDVTESALQFLDAMIARRWNGELPLRVSTFYWGLNFRRWLGISVRFSTKDGVVLCRLFLTACRDWLSGESRQQSGNHRRINTKRD
jgi:hypothetical protein